MMNIPSREDMCFDSDWYYRLYGIPFSMRPDFHPCTIKPKSELSKLSDKILRVVYNNPATIILWKDGTKTVVKIQNDEVYDREKGFLMCIAKKLGGDRGNYNNVIKRWCE